MVGADGGFPLPGVRHPSIVSVHKRTSERGRDGWSKAFCDKGLGVSWNEIAARISVAKTRIHSAFFAFRRAVRAAAALGTNCLDRGAHRGRLECGIRIAECGIKAPKGERD